LKLLKAHKYKPSGGSMQKRNIKMLVLSAALATTAAFAVAKQQQNFSDIPAGHWASEAVQAIAAEGLITGYQDGTFKGQRTLTRYEAATIFYRLLKSGKLAQATPATQTTTQQGMAEVSPELTALQTQATETNTRLTALEDQVKTLSAAPASTSTAPAASADVEARIKAVEDEIAALKAAPAATGTTPAATTANPELEARIKTLEDELAALKTAAAAPASTATPAASSDLEARLKALEDKVAATPAAPAAPATSSDTDARLKALEDKIAALPTAPAAPAAGGDVTALTATVTAQETRIATLEAALTKVQSDIDGLKAAAATAPATTTTTTTTPVTTGSSATTDTTSTGPTTRIAFGVGGATNITGPGVGAGASPFGLYGQLGITNLAGPFGIRAFADLSSVPAAGAQIMLNFGDGGFDPYVGIGGGVVFNSPTNFFIGGSVGANIGFGGGLGVFAEINPRYNLSFSQFSVKAAFGLRLATPRREARGFL
jgi:S-layer homology domain